MKKILFLTFLVLLGLGSCKNTYDTPKEKMLSSMTCQKCLSKKIVNIEITDTIYQSQITEHVKMHEMYISSLRDVVIKSKKERDSIKRVIEYPQYLNDTTLISSIIKSADDCNRINYYKYQLDNYQKVNYQDEDSICGYFILVKTEDNECFEFAVTKDYRVICPKSIFE